MPSKLLLLHFVATFAAWNERTIKKLCLSCLLFNNFSVANKYWRLMIPAITLSDEQMIWMNGGHWKSLRIQTIQTFSAIFERDIYCQTQKQHNHVEKENFVHTNGIFGWKTCTTVFVKMIVWPDKRRIVIAFFYSTFSRATYVVNLFFLHSTLEKWHDFHN